MAVGSRIPLTVCGSVVLYVKAFAEMGDSISFFCSVFMENPQGLFLPQMLMLLSRITTRIQSSMMR